MSYERQETLSQIQNPTHRQQEILDIYHLLQMICIKDLKALTLTTVVSFSSKWPAVATFSSLFENQKNQNRHIFIFFFFLLFYYG